MLQLLPRVLRRTGASGAVLLVALAACSSAAARSGVPAASPVQTDRLRTEGAATDLDVVTHTEQYVGVATIPGTPERVWAALRPAYAEFDLPIEAADPAARQVASTLVRTRYRLGGHRLSRFLDCGTGAFGPNADQYDVALRVRSSVVPDESGVSALRSTVTATGSTTGTGNGVIRCSSTGQLEAAIAKTATSLVTR